MSSFIDQHQSLSFIESFRLSQKGTKTVSANVRDENFESGEPVSRKSASVRKYRYRNFYARSCIDKFYKSAYLWTVS